MKQTKSASQCILRNPKGELFCLFNKKYSKYAPIGGKFDYEEEDAILCLLREVKEEVGSLDIMKITETGPHILNDTGNDMNWIVFTFIVDVKDETLLSTEEDFLEAVKLTESLINTLTPSNSYTSLLAIIERLYNGCIWHKDYAKI